MDSDGLRLWLDDERDPTDPFIQQNYGARPDDVWVKTVEEAIQLVESGKVEAMSLDHDLGYDKSGYDFCKWLERECFFGRQSIRDFKVSIHTNNPVGRKSMEQCINALLRRSANQNSTG